MSELIFMFVFCVLTQLVGSSSTQPSNVPTVCCSGATLPATIGACARMAPAPWAADHRKNSAPVPTSTSAMSDRSRRCDRFDRVLGNRRRKRRPHCDRPTIRHRPTKLAAWMWRVFDIWDRLLRSSRCWLCFAFWWQSICTTITGSVSSSCCTGNGSTTRVAAVMDGVRNQRIRRRRRHRRR